MNIKQLLSAAALVLGALAAQAAQAAQGEVQKVDAAKGTVRLKHGEIKNLDMPPMTMVFRVRDAALLANLVEGDQVEFEVAKEAGAYVVTAIRKR